MGNATFMEMVRHFVTSPLPWIMFAVVNFIGAVFLGEVVSRRWRETAIWIPVGLIALLAIRPYPKGSETSAAEVSAGHVAQTIYAQDGLYHYTSCERLHEHAGIPITESQAKHDGLCPCPDCIHAKTSQDEDRSVERRGVQRR